MFQPGSGNFAAPIWKRPYRFVQRHPRRAGRGPAAPWSPAAEFPEFAGKSQIL